MLILSEQTKPTDTPGDALDRACRRAERKLRGHFFSGPFRDGRAEDRSGRVTAVYYRGTIVGRCCRGGWAHQGHARHCGRSYPVRGEVTIVIYL